jgi:hypothetical protein
MYIFFLFFFFVFVFGGIGVFELKALYLMAGAPPLGPRLQSFFGDRVLL